MDHKILCKILTIVRYFVSPSKTLLLKTEYNNLLLIYFNFIKLIKSPLLSIRKLINISDLVNQTIHNKLN